MSAIAKQSVQNPVIEIAQQGIMITSQCFIGPGAVKNSNLISAEIRERSR